VVNHARATRESPLSRREDNPDSVLQSTVNWARNSAAAADRESCRVADAMLFR
jgi:hypothetical protein